MEPGEVCRVLRGGKVRLSGELVLLSGEALALPGICKAGKEGAAEADRCAVFVTLAKPLRMSDSLLSAAGLDSLGERGSS